MYIYTYICTYTQLYIYRAGCVRGTVPAALTKPLSGRGGGEGAGGVRGTSGGVEQAARRGAAGILFFYYYFFYGKKWSMWRR